MTARTGLPVAAVGLIVALVVGCSEVLEGPLAETRGGVIYVANGRAEDAPDVPNVTFELLGSFGVDREPTEAILSSVTDVTVDEAGNVYVLDGADRIVAFAPEGHVMWSAGQQGEGPGDLSNATAIEWDGRSTLYVANDSGTQVDLWSAAGEFLETRSLAGMQMKRARRIVGFLGENTLVMSGVEYNTAGARICVINIRDWRETAVFAVNVSKEPEPRRPVFIHVSLVDGLITAGDFDSYEFKMFAPDGRLAKVISREVNGLVGYGVSSSAWTVFSWLYPPLESPTTRHLISSRSWVDTEQDPNQLMAQRAKAPPSEREPLRWLSSIDIFDQHGRFLFSTPAEPSAKPSIGRPIVIANDGSMYTASEKPFPIVRRYRVAFGS